MPYFDIFEGTLTLCDWCHKEPVMSPGEWCSDCRRRGAMPPRVSPNDLLVLRAQDQCELVMINGGRVAARLDMLD